MEKTIKLKIKDYRDSFHEPHKKNPYYLFIEYGEKTFAFSNKEKAKRFLSRFKKESTSYYKELGYYMARCYSLNITMVHIIPYSDYMHISKKLNLISLRFSHILNAPNSTDIAIGREINIIYYELHSVYSFLITLLSKNNRSYILLQSTKRELKSIIRLKKDLELLLTDSEGIEKITKIDAEKRLFLHKMLIA